MSKDFYNEAYQADHPSHYDGGEDGMPERITILTKHTSDWLNQTGLAMMPKAKILEIGCGMGFLARIHPGWHGAEYSKTAVARIKERDGQDARIFEEDAQSLSFENTSFDGVFSWAALEHVPNPNKAFLEIDRILRGGYGLIAPAWNCRSWTVKKIEQRLVSELSWLERIERYSIPLREMLIVRALLASPLRIWGELMLRSQDKTAISLRYKTLHPRWDLIERYGHVSDDDAVADIDPHAGICFFKSRGYQIMSHPNLIKRIAARHEPLVIRKPL